MPTYVALANFTDQGIKNFRDTVRRSEDFRGVVENSGGVDGVADSERWSGSWSGEVVTGPPPRTGTSVANLIRGRRGHGTP